MNGRFKVGGAEHFSFSRGLRAKKCLNFVLVFLKLREQLKLHPWVDFIL